MKSLFLSIILIAIAFLSFSQVSKEEKNLLQIIDRNNDQAVELLKKTVNMNSGTMNFKGVKDVGEVFLAELREIGLDASWVDGSEWNRAGHLIASTTNKSNVPNILLIGHLDTVFEPDSPFQSYTLVGDSLMRGPGTTDMKGGNVIIVQILKAFKEAGVLDKMNIEVIMMGDEERSGRPIEKARYHLKEMARMADIALGFEDGDGKPETIVVSRRGSQSWELNISGVQAHSSQVFADGVGAGAIYEASRILHAFYQELSTFENLTFNPGLFLGGTDIEYDENSASGTAYGKSNIVARDAIIKGDLRAVSPEQLKQAQNKMQEIVQANLPQTQATLTFKDGAYPPLAPSEGNYEILKMYDQISQELGYGEVDAVNPRNAGAADISFTSGLVEMAADGLGLSGYGGHSREETAYLHMLPVQTKRAALLIYRLSKKKN